MNGAGASLLSAIRGPVILIVLGVLLEIDYAGKMSFSRTWPVILIAFGLFKLLEHSGSKSA